MTKMKMTLVVMVAAFGIACSGGDDNGRPTAPSAPPVPNYAGTWSGNYTVTGCTQSGGVSLANVCGLMGQTPPYRMSLQQGGSSVTGSFSLGSINFPSTGGTVAADGSLTLQATTLRDGITVIVTWALRNTPGTPSLTGTITQAWTSTTLSGQANVAGTISSAIRSVGVQASSTGAPSGEPVTLEQFAAMAAGK